MSRRIQRVFGTMEVSVCELVRAGSTCIVLMVTVTLTVTVDNVATLIEDVTARDVIRAASRIAVMDRSSDRVTSRCSATSTRSSGKPATAIKLRVSRSSVSSRIPAVTSVIRDSVTNLSLTLLLTVFAILFSATSLGDNCVGDMNKRIGYHKILLFSGVVTLSMFAFITVTLSIVIRYVTAPLFLRKTRFKSTTSLFGVLNDRCIIALLFMCFIVTVTVVVGGGMVDVVVTIYVYANVFALVFDKVGVLVRGVKMGGFSVGSCLVIGRVSRLSLDTSTGAMNNTFTMTTI